MTDDTIVTLVAGIPNFAGFTLLSLMLYRALMASIENNRLLANKIIECYQHKVNTDD